MPHSGAGHFYVIFIIPGEESPLIFILLRKKTTLRRVISFIEGETAQPQRVGLLTSSVLRPPRKANSAVVVKLVLCLS